MGTVKGNLDGTHAPSPSQDSVARWYSGRGSRYVSVGSFTCVDILELSLARPFLCAAKPPKHFKFPGLGSALRESGEARGAGARPSSAGTAGQREKKSLGTRRGCLGQEKGMSYYCDVLPDKRDVGLSEPASSRMHFVSGSPLVLPGRAKKSMLPPASSSRGTSNKVVGFPGFIRTRPKCIVPLRESSVSFKRSFSPEE